MRYRFVLWVGLGVLIAGCAAEPMRGVVSRDAVQPLWPLEGERSWTYTFDEGAAAEELVYRLAGPVVIAGTPYTLVATWRDGVRADTLAVRNDRRGLFLHTYQSAGPAVGPGRFFKYPVSDNETYDFGGPVRVAYRTLTVPAGTFDVLRYTFDEGDGARSEIAFAPGVGLIWSRNTATAARTRLIAYE